MREKYMENRKFGGRQEGRDHKAGWGEKQGEWGCAYGVGGLWQLWYLQAPHVGLNTVYTFPHLTLSTVLPGEYFHPNLADMETEAQRIYYFPTDSCT